MAENKNGAEKKSNKERIKEIVAGIEDGIQNLFQSEKYAQYLRTMSRFHNYSLNNTILIHLQKPDATVCAGFKQWQSKFGRHVKKGERGITIIAPTPFRKKIEEEKLDPDTQLPMRDPDGKIIMEEKTIKIPMFRPVKVFDVSQTEGKPLPQLAANLTGDVRQYEAFMEALRRTAAVPISFKPLAPNLDGYFSPQNQSITLREGMSQVQTVSAAVHEIAHSVLHNLAASETRDAPAYQVAEICHTPALFSDGRIPEKDVPESLFRYELRGGPDGKPDAVSGRVKENFAGTVITGKPLSIPENGVLNLSATDGLLLSGDRATVQAFQKRHGKDRNTAEVEAESVSYAVCQYYGIETGSNSFGYIAAWSKDRSLKELRASLETITKTANSLITGIDKHFREVCKERGIVLAGQEEEKETEASKGQSAPEVPEAETAQAADVVTVTEAVPVTVPEAAPPTQTPETITESPSVQKPESVPETPPIQEPEPVTRTQESEAVTEQPQTLESVPAMSDVVTTTETRTVSATRETDGAELPERMPPEPQQPDTVLDEYPMPDPGVSFDALTGVGYTDEDLLPLSLERACQLLEQDMSVYTLQRGENPEMAFDADELREQPEGTVFAVPREEWEAAPDFQRAVDERMERQEEREAAFLNHAEDCLAVYQARAGDEFRNLRFEPLKTLEAEGLTPQRANYDLVYAAPLPEGTGPETVFKWFNLDPPPDYRHSSVSVSDILAIKHDGVITCHYVDRAGFAQVPGFLEKENPLKNAELLTEDEPNMIDGIINNGAKEAAAPPTVAELEARARAGQPISLLDLAEATRREAARPERGERKSVLAKLRDKPPGHEQKRTAPKKSAERGL